MQDLNVLIVQVNQAWEDKITNLNHFEILLNEVETNQVDLIVLPEMFHTGFTMSSEALAEEMKDSQGIDWLKSLAKDKNTGIYTSLIIKENNSFFNRGIFVYPNGEIKTYDKRKLFALAEENLFFSPGKKTTIVDFKGWKIQLQICYDLRFPEISRNQIDGQENPTFDILIYVANWPEKRNLHWKNLLIARGIENQSYVIGVNRVGVDGKGLNYSGDSCLVDPLGATIACQPNHEQLLFVKLSWDNLNKVRLSLPFLKDISS
jgi:predicted amidohydrolase